MTKKIGWTEKLAKEWSSYKPPSRPSKSEVEIYENYIKKFMPGSSVLILGSTPELRDLCAKHKLNVTICDWSEEVFASLKLLMKFKQAKEKFYKQNWLDMNIGNFDLILGDCAMTVVNFKNLDKFIANISNNLVPGGFAVQRIWVREKGQAFNLTDINKLFNKKTPATHWYTKLLFPVFLYYYDKEAESLSGAELYNHVKKDVENGLLERGVLNLLELVKNHKTSNNVLVKEDLVVMLRKYFEIVSYKNGHDIFRDNAYIYELKKI